MERLSVEEIKRRLFDSGADRVWSFVSTEHGWVATAASAEHKSAVCQTGRTELAAWRAAYRAWQRKGGA